MARLHARLRGCWLAVSKLDADKGDEATTIAEFDAFIHANGGLRTTATMACEAELTRLRGVLVEREKPVRQLLESMYNETYSARSRLHDVFMEIEEEECPVQRMEKLQTELSRLEERKEGMKTFSDQNMPQAQPRNRRGHPPANLLHRATSHVAADVLVAT